ARIGRTAAPAGRPPWTCPPPGCPSRGRQTPPDRTRQHPGCHHLPARLVGTVAEGGEVRREARRQMTAHVTLEDVVTIVAMLVLLVALVVDTSSTTRPRLVSGRALRSASPRR